jgi:hypothetical protein
VRLLFLNIGARRKVSTCRERRESRSAKADAQFFRIRGSMPSEPAPLLTNNLFSPKNYFHKTHVKRNKNLKLPHLQSNFSFKKNSKYPRESDFSQIIKISFKN